MIIRAGRAHPMVMAAIHAQCFPAGEAWDAAVIAAQLSMPGVAAFLHHAGGMIMIRNAADEAEILTLAVTPMARRRGLGRALVGEAASHVRAAGAGRLFLEVSATNCPAQALYLAAGFREVGRRRRYYPNGSDAFVLALTLAATAEP